MELNWKEIEISLRTIFCSLPKFSEKKLEEGETGMFPRLWVKCLLERFLLYSLSVLGLLTVKLCFYTLKTKLKEQTISGN